jgi:LysR substrate binding domain.
MVCEADDMAMLRLLVCQVDGIALLPPVVVKEELAEKELFELCQVPDLHELFHAITVSRRYQSPYVEELLQRAETVLAG